MASVCVVCGKRITWTFSLCSKCEAEYGKRVEDWPEWVREEVNASRRARRREASDDRHMADNCDSSIMLTFVSSFSVEELIIAKESIASAFTTDEVDIKDSDWDAVCDWSV